MTYLFLYTELAGYSLDCFRVHLQLNPEDQIHVVHHPVNAEAPFKFNVPDGVYLHEKAALGMEGIYELMRRIKPNLVLVSGWMDRDYVRICRMSRKTYRIVLCLDNTWRGTWKQRLLLPLAKLILRSFTRACWVPGEPQRKYALMLGFKPDRVFTGFYATDLSRFQGATLDAKTTGRPKRLLCVARYIPEKGYDLLWDSFISLYEEGYQDWELWCVGTGQLYEQRVEHKAIRHLGFVQPEEFNYLVSQTDVFILASLFEPWGMVVQEFAAAGMPLILSDAVNAHHAFLKHQQNGFLFQSNNPASLRSAILSMMQCDEDALHKMASTSKNLAAGYGAEFWSATLSRLASK
jgi:glycosyltransferase involved in cell wall biosynthesis